jgi:hypothetical protein
MTESEDTNFTTFHLDGEAHEWWYHGLVTLGHSHITLYLEFTKRLMERFDRRDPELHFRDLTQLRQTGSVEPSSQSSKERQWSYPIYRSTSWWCCSQRHWRSPWGVGLRFSSLTPYRRPLCARETWGAQRWNPKPLPNPLYHRETWIR